MSSNSGDLIRLYCTIRSILVVNTFPLIVLVELLIYCSLNKWPHTIDEEEGGDAGEDKSGPVARKHQVKMTTSLN